MTDISQEQIDSLRKGIAEKYHVNDDVAETLSKIAYSFACHISNDINNATETGDAQCNHLFSSLRKRGFDKIAADLEENLLKKRKQKKEAVFNVLQNENYVAKNHHFEFARLLLSSKHQVPVPHITEYSDVDN